jgi:hypothetical protein
VGDLEAGAQSTVEHSRERRILLEREGLQLFQDVILDSSRGPHEGIIASKRMMLAHLTFCRRESEALPRGCAKEDSATSLKPLTPARMYINMHK